MENVLATHKVSKYFYEPERFQVLKEIDLTVRRGEFLSLVGKSGCGKSTLMYILSTMDTDYEGELEIAGERLTGKGQDVLASFRNRHIGFGLSVLISKATFPGGDFISLDHFPVQFNPRFYLIGIVFGVSTTAIAGYMPSRKAARVDPIEILRGQ